MIFISKYKNFRLGIRPSTKRIVNSASGSEEVIHHKGVTVEFQNASFDTKNWRQYSRPDSPDSINVIKSEDDLIRLMRASEYFGLDFFERTVESISDRKARLQAELAKIEAEESAENPENAPVIDHGDDKPEKSKSKPKSKGKSASKVML